MNFKRRFYLTMRLDRIVSVGRTALPSNFLSKVKAEQLVKILSKCLFFLIYFVCTSKGCSKLKYLSRIYAFWNVIRLNYGNSKRSILFKYEQSRNYLVFSKSLFIYDLKEHTYWRICIFLASLFQSSKPLHCKIFWIW